MSSACGSSSRPGDGRGVNLRLERDVLLCVNGLRALLLVPIAILLAAATCVTSVQQRGDAGPWTGEVVNGGDQTVNGVAATARVFDQEGREYYPGRVGVVACPSKLPPGERGAFELFLPTENQNPEYVLQDPVLPYRAEFDALAHENVGTGVARGDGLYVEELSRDVGGRSVRIRVTNNGAAPYVSQVTVCGIVRTADGALAEVGRADAPPLPSALFVGESLELTMYFRELPAGAISIRYHALGLVSAPYPACCPLGETAWRSYDLGAFRVLLPPDWRYEPAQGIDSYVGSFVGPGVTLSFDFGIYSNTLPYEGDSRYRVHYETIGGFAGKIVMPNTDVGETGVYIAGLGTKAFPLGESRLTVSGRDLDAAERAIALQIFRSIRVCECVLR